MNVLNFSKIDRLDFLNHSKESNQEEEENLEVFEVVHNLGKHIDQASKSLKDSAETNDLTETKNCNGYLKNVHLNKFIRVLFDYNIIFNFKVSIPI